MTTGFTQPQKALILARDPYCLMRCGRASEVANHRANRGSGGAASANRVANGCGLCHECNGLIESSYRHADDARRWGVKISRYADPTTEPVWRVIDGPAYYLDDGTARPVR